MAEGFARAYGSDCLSAASAGLAPASLVQPLTRKVMRAKNISLDGQVPRDILLVDLDRVDLIVNVCGCELPFPAPCPVVEWKVRDPIGASESVYERVRDDLEARVMRLVLELRRREQP
jgi:protein-tyrosine-phosphatase